MRKLLSAVTITCLAVGLCAAPAFSQMNKKFEGKLVRSEKVLGAPVFANDGRIGEIKEVIFDENTGGVSRAIISMGGYLGIGDKLTAVEWDKFTANRAEDDNYKFVMTADKATLMKEPSFAENNWPDLKQGWQGENIKDKKLVRLSKTNEVQLFDKNGKEIGNIKDLMIDAESGRVAYAVVSFSDDFINKGDKLTMIPWPLVRQSEQATTGFVLHTEKEQIEKADFFAPNEWPNVNDMVWNKTVYDHYEVTPFWTGA